MFFVRKSDNLSIDWRSPSCSYLPAADRDNGLRHQFTLQNAIKIVSVTVLNGIVIIYLKRFRS